ncbi:MAG TPA: methylated-DNA--[protein]-cysteine S-methyltransferase [Phycisphaerales bacterium]|nr:methylated-DNA--[protein]-cysteine S-methyltransferase [Phycisphaerales bacterium]
MKQATIQDGPDAPASPIVVTEFDSPLGGMVAAATDEGVCLLEFKDRRALKTELRDLPKLTRREIAPAGSKLPGPLEQLLLELAAYFDGSLKHFDVPLMTPGTAWEQSVWGVLRRVPYGVTRSYGEVADELGKPGGARAVGLANGRNRIAIVIPCHRIINSDGGLHGYGGGLDRKRWLLEHEARGARTVLFS